MLFTNGDIVNVFRSKMIFEPPVFLESDLYLISAHLPLPHTAIRSERPVL